jgi:hypothetical protein
MTQIKLITDQAELAKEIKSLAGRAKKLDRDFQVAALSAIGVFKEHGNVFYINAVYNALGKGARHVAMTAWLTAFGGVSANESEGKDITPFVKDKNKQVDMEAGAKTPWYDMKPSAKPDQVLDLLKLALALVSKASKPKEGQEVAHAAMLPELQALCEKYASEGETGEKTDDDGATGGEAPAGQPDPLSLTQ